MTKVSKNDRGNRRGNKVRSRIKGTAERPRFSVYRSNKHMYGQLIDDEAEKTLVGVSDKAVGEDKKKKVNKSEKARILGREIAKRAAKAKIKNVVFDRGRYKYQGKVKAVAEGARAEGLIF